MREAVGFYLAARLEDQATALWLAAALETATVEECNPDGVRPIRLTCTARWVRQGSFDSPTLGIERCLEDIVAADVFVQWNPKDIHRSGTGGRHVELGVALAIGKPIIVLGEAEHDFHHHAHVFVRAVDTPADELALHVNDLASIVRSRGGSLHRMPPAPFGELYDRRHWPSRRPA